MNLRKIILIVVAVSASLTLYSHAQQELHVPQSVAPQTAIPDQLRIPRLNISAHIEGRGLSPDGSVDVPTDPAVVAWFTENARPGDEGSAVITGHYGWYGNAPAVFDHLNQLRVGDTIAIDTVDGTTLNFVVRDLKTYGADDIVPKVFSSLQGVHLNLITCSGDWNKAQQQFSQRLVVFTDLITN